MDEGAEGASESNEYSTSSGRSWEGGASGGIYTEDGVGAECCCCRRGVGASRGMEEAVRCLLGGARSLLAGEAIGALFLALAAS